MKNIICIILLFVPVLSFGQGSPYAAVDRYAGSIGYLPVDSLAAKLTVPFNTDSEKVRAIFYWITQHIDYDVEGFHSKSKAITEYYEIVDSGAVQARFRMRFAQKALSTKKAVCEEYAALFKVLCDHAQIECEVVRGSVKNSISAIGKPMVEDHAWNIVKINGKRRPADPCWASGYCNKEVTRFYKKFNEYYYLTAPEVFIYDHYSSDSSRQLIKTIVSKNDFINFPCLLLQRPNTICNHFSPANGILRKKIGDTVTITLELSEVDSFSFYVASRIIEYDAKGEIIVPPPEMMTELQAFRQEGKRLIYDYKVWNNRVKGLYVMYNQRYLVAYKLDVSSF